MLVPFSKYNAKLCIGHCINVNIECTLFPGKRGGTRQHVKMLKCTKQARHFPPSRAAPSFHPLQKYLRRPEIYQLHVGGEGTVAGYYRAQLFLLSRPMVMDDVVRWCKMLKVLLCSH